ncbi:MAG: DoxX family protein [Acidimicrobiales bacterium]
MTRRLVAVLLTVGGVAHFVVPDAYARIVPPALGHPRVWVYAGGAAEVAAGALLAGRRTRRVGGYLSAAVLVAIFPANVQHALDQGGLWWVRLPFQAPLVWWALRAARRTQSGPASKRASRLANSSAGPDGTR